MPTAAPSTLESCRPIRILSIPPAPPAASPIPPEALIDLFLAEVECEPHLSSSFWTRESAKDELRAQMRAGQVAIVWELIRPPVPVGFAVCEGHRPESVIAAIDFPMSVLNSIYARLGRGPFLVFTHLSLRGVIPAQQGMVLRKLVKDLASSVMREKKLSEAVGLFPVSGEKDSQERQALRKMFQDRHEVLANDTRPERRRELWGFRFCAR